VLQFGSGAGKAETMRIVKPQLIIMPVFWLIRYILVCVCVTRQSHQGLGQQQEINFAEETVLTRFITRVIVIEKFCVSSFWSKWKLFIFTIPPSDTDSQNSGLC